jgi:glutamine synthetase
VPSLVSECEALVGEFADAIRALETANLADNQPDEEAAAWATYMRDTVVPAMNAVRDVADRLEKIVADDLWPLPKYSEILFIK